MPAKSRDENRLPTLFLSNKITGLILGFTSFKSNHIHDFDEFRLSKRNILPISS